MVDRRKRTISFRCSSGKRTCSASVVDMTHAHSSLTQHLHVHTPAMARRQKQERWRKKLLLHVHATLSPFFYMLHPIAGRCSRVRVRRVAVPKNIQPARTKCSWTTTQTGKLSSFGFDPCRSSNFTFCSSTVGLSLTADRLRVPRQWLGMPRLPSLAGVTNCCWIHPTFFYLKWRPSREWRDTSQIYGLFDHRSLSKRLQTRLPLAN